MEIVVQKSCLVSSIEEKKDLKKPAAVQPNLEEKKEEKLLLS